MKNLMKRKVLLVSFLLVSIMLLSACSKSSLGDATQMDKTLSIANDKTISINMDGADVSVLVSTDENVHITYYEYDIVKYDILETESGVSIEQNIDRGSGLNPNSIEKGITILMPKEFVGSFVAVLDSSNIKLDKLSANNINIDSDNGDVKGSVMGVEADYIITTSVDLGDSNISSGGGTDGSKVLTINVDLGDIEISFEG